MKRIVLFTVYTFLFSWTCWGLQYLGQEKILPEFVQIFGMFGLFGPLFGYIMMLKYDKKEIKKSFKKLFVRAPRWTTLFTLTIPMFLSVIAYLVYLFFETGEPQEIGVTIITIIPIALMILFVGGPVEEFGWRGYLLPQLRSKYSFLVTIMIMGLIHGIWHFPLHYLNGTVQSALPVYEFLIITVFITVQYVFIYEFTKSIIPMILLHWFSNLSSAIFPYYYNQAGRYGLLVITLIVDIVLIYILVKRSGHNERIVL